MLVQVNTKIDKDLKEEVEEILNDLGLNISDAMRIFFNKIKMENGIPFNLKKKNIYTFDNLRDEVKEELLESRKHRNDKDSNITINSVEEYNNLKKSGELEKYKYKNFTDSKVFFETLND